MKTVDYLREVYGYGVPIFLKDIRIGKKSKTAIRQDLSRATKEGTISKKTNGVYYLQNKEENITNISFDDIITKKYIKDDFGFIGLDINIYGYITGEAFLTKLGISQQIPATLEIVTNKTSCKRVTNVGWRKIILRKPKVEVDHTNYQMLQFLDAFYYLSDDDVEENKELLKQYISKHLSKYEYVRYIKYYSLRINKLIVEKGLIYAFN